MDVSLPPHFTYRRLVEFADTDVAGIMHFSNFFRFVECAEHAFFRSLGQRVHHSEGTTQHGWPRIEVSCKFHRPARFEQTLEVGLRIEEVRTTSLRYSFTIAVADDPARELLAAGAFSIIHVEIDTASHLLRKSPIPQPLRDQLAAVMKGQTDPARIASR